jgi:two-component system, sensor histidine kinase and response regulator
MAKILIVEDELGIRNNLSRLLKLEGNTVYVAENGNIGVTMARTKLPDLVICDLRMPELDGYGVLRALKQSSDTAGIPIVILTASADQSHRAAGLSLGAAAFLTKPFDSRELLALISNVLSAKS